MTKANIHMVSRSTVISSVSVLISSLQKIGNFGMGFLRTIRSWFWQYGWPKVYTTGMTRKQIISQARRWLVWWLVQMDQSHMPEMIQATGAIKKWLIYILNYFVFFLTNGPVEGLDTKIKLVIPEAFGLPSFERRRARLLFQCEASP